MIKVKAKATINGKRVFSGDGKYYSAVFDAEKEIRSRLYELYWKNGKRIPPPVEGQTGKMTVELSWECTMNRRAPARPKAEIAADRARRAAKYAARQKQHKEWEEEAKQRVINVRKRIQRQIDHAFATGKSGTEPVSMYITCEDCDAPATQLTLSQPMPKGVQVLDEDLIIGAQCKTHSQYYGQRGGEKILCSRLEFFYDGVRQIALKAKGGAA